MTDKRKSLSEDSIVSAPRNRRSVLQLGLGAATAAATLAIGSVEEAEAQNCTDSDAGYGADRAGFGRWCQRGTGITDSDPNDRAGFGRGRRPGYTGINDGDPTDPSGYGRGGNRGRGGYTGITDADPGDPAGYGRGARGTGITDRDPGDPVGNGRGGFGGRTGLTDSDPGDRAGFGRRGW